MHVTHKESACRHGAGRNQGGTAELCPVPFAARQRGRGFLCGEVLLRDRKGKQP